MQTRLILAVLFLMFHQAVSAQPITAPQNSPQSQREYREHRRKDVVDFKTAAVFYPFAVLTDNFRLGVEHRPSDKLGLRGIFNFGYGEDNVFYDAHEFTSYGAEVQARYYPMKGNPMVYTGLYASARSINLTRTGGIFYDQFGMPIETLMDYNAQAFGFGVIGGMQFEIAKVFLLDGYVGAGPNIPSGDYRTGSVGVGNFGGGGSIWGFRKGMRYNGGLNFGVILFK